MSNIDLFLAALSNNGLSPRGFIGFTGGKNIRRFHVDGDKTNRKNGWYWLDCHGEMAWGAFGHWRSGINKTWISKEKKTLSITERKIIEKKSREYEAQETIKHADTAVKAKKQWNAAVKAVSHPYADRKGINLYNTRISNGRLLVPLYKNKEIVNLQIINSAGVKLFLRGGEFKGCYSYISGNTDRIYLCEGYATGASIVEATGSMVIVAFSAGNMLSVAKLVREQYKTTQIVIAADNDLNTPGNPGLTAGKKAAEAVAGKLVYPTFIHDGLSDFNDLHALSGLEAIKKILFPSEIIEKNDLTTKENSWKSQLIPGNYKDDNFPYPYDSKSKLNAYLFIRNLHNIFSYNEFSNEILVIKQPPWDNDNFMPRRVSEQDLFRFAAHIERYGLKIGKDVIFDISTSIAHENKINPPRDFFDTLIWDGIPRLNRWLTYFMGAIEQGAEYLALVGSKWLIAAVNRIYEPGCKFDSVLILEGEQGIGKSNALRTLATFNGEDYFLDSVGDIRNKDTLLAIEGKMIIEMAELSSLRKADNEEIKAFISRQIDEYRPPYGRITIRRPRYNVLAGTTNEISEGYLTDVSGNRRYWPVKCGKIDNESLIREKDQLWAEAVVRYKKNERIWLTDEENHLAIEQQQNRMMIDAWHERIGNIAEHATQITIDRVFEHLGLGAKDMTRINRTRIRTTLQSYNFKETRINGRRVWKKKLENY
jgi:putative DNA primase/helicase